MRRALVAVTFFPAVDRALAAGNSEWTMVACFAAFTRNGLRIFMGRAARRFTRRKRLKSILRRLLIGYAIGVVIGLPLGLLTSTSDYF